MKASKEVSDWIKLFEGSALYRHDSGRLFGDWLELCVCALANGTQEERYLATAKRYDRKELDTMGQLLGLLILIHGAHAGPGRWYDALGQIYEQLAARSRTSRLGQFFTPPAVCDSSARIILGDIGKAAGKRVLDPAAGSGRMLLAAHALQPQLDLVAAADVDAVCAKMCAINFWLHGVRGEVACMDSLTLRWQCAYQVHPRATWPYITRLDEDRKHLSVLYAAPPADLFCGVHEEAADYGEPFVPCISCGQCRDRSCMILDGQLVSPWSMEADGLLCLECGAPLANLRAASMEARE